MKSLLKLLESLERKKAIGTLVLGRRGKSCEIFLEEDKLYFAGKEYSGKVDATGLLRSGIIESRVSPGVLDTAISSSNLFQKPLPEVLQGQGLINPEEHRSLMGSHLLEEIFTQAQRHGESFAFHDEQVPVHLLGDDPRKIDLPLSQVLELLRVRCTAIDEIEVVVPSRKEVFVVTEKGMAHRNTGEVDFAERRIFALIDGFRDLSEVIRDVPFFEFFVVERVAGALQEGYIKKTLCPEIRELNAASLSREDAERHLPAFKSAVKYSVDEIGARERLALVYERLGQAEEALIQYNFIGDALYRMRKTPKALKAFQRALELRRDNPAIADKVIRIHIEAAEEALAAGRRGEAIEYLKAALEIRPEADEVFDRLLDLHLQSNELRAIAELCDLAAARSRTLRDITPALKVLEMVTQRFPREKLFRKKLINLFIDFGREADAVSHLEALAQADLTAGQNDRAQEIFEKILRIAPDRSDIRKRVRRLTRRASARRLPGIRVSLPRLVLLIVGVAAGYEFWSSLALKAIREDGNAYALSPQADPEVLVPGEREKVLGDLSRKTEVFEERFPLSIFTFEARRLGRSYREEASRLAGERERRKAELLSRASLLQSQGRPAEGRETLKRLLELDASDPWRVRAVESLKRYDAYEKDAGALRHEAEAARAAGSGEKAYRLLRRLLEEFPFSDAAAGADLPIEVRTIPEGAVISVGGSSVGPSPKLVSVHPGRTTAIDLEAAGFERLREEVSVDAGPSRLFLLARRPLWKASLSAPARFPPVLSADLVLVVLENGTLTARARADGSPRWSHPGLDVVSPIAAPLPWNGSVFLARNDGFLLRFSSTGDMLERMKTGGLPSTPLVAVGEGEFAFGTANGLVSAWRPAEGRASWNVQIGGAPACLVRGASGRLLVTTEKGRVVAVDSKTGRLVWEAAIDGPDVKLVRGPKEIGGAVVLQTADSRLIAFDAGTGGLLWRRARAPAGAVTIPGAEGKSVLLLAEQIDSGTALIGTDPLTGRETSRTTLPLAAAGLEELPGGIGVTLASGGFLYLDPKGLKPLWASRPGSGRTATTTSDGKLVILTTTGGELLAFPVER